MSSRDQPGAAPLLEVRELTLRFGGLTAVDRVSFQVFPGEIVSVIGPNGAGKTSLFNAITGLHPPSSGLVLVQGRPLRRRIDAWTCLRWLAVGLLTALGMGLGADLLGLWSASGVEDYAAPEPFAWGACAQRLAGELAASGWVHGGALIGLVLGVSAAAAVWRRSRQEPEVAVRSGVARTFQNIRLFKELSVLDNVLVGLDARSRCGGIEAVLRTPRQRREEQAVRRHAQELLERVGLGAVAGAPAGSLPYGHQRRLEIARALACNPTILLLDEPAAGMNPNEADELIALIRTIRDRQVTVLLIEHHMRVVMGISDRIVVLHFGRPIAEGAPGSGTGPVLLELDDLHAGYGGITALRGVNLRVHAGEIVALIGANGAGKTTTLMCCSGITPMRSGRLTFSGREISREPAHRIVAMGLAHVPEGRRIFAQLTVQENLMLGAYSRRDRSTLASEAERAFELFPILKERRSQKGGTLSGGEQQMLAISRALMAKPRLLLMDEPSMGVAPLLVARIFAAIRTLNAEGLSILLVEQNARLALATAARAYVLETGRIVLEGPAATLAEHPRVRAAYLGEAGA